MALHGNPPPIVHTTVQVQRGVEVQHIQFLTFLADVTRIPLHNKSHVYQINRKARFVVLPQTAILVHHSTWEAGNAK
jgi:hypothetical protein